jgi:hypothetical protein
MVSNIIEHLKVIKIYTDYKKTGLDTINFFWEYIKRGGDFRDFSTNKSIDYEIFELNQEEPTDEELERYRKRQEYYENTDIRELYFEHVKDEIDFNLRVDRAKIPDLIELTKIYKEVIDKNKSLSLYIDTNKDIFNEYVDVAQNCLPQDFFNVLSKSQESKEETVTKDDKILKYILPDEAYKFYEFERKLIESDWIIPSGNSMLWDVNKNSLIDFCRILKNKKILRPNKNPQDLARFLEVRYNIDIGDQIKPSKYKHRMLKHSEFHFLEL